MHACMREIISGAWACMACMREIAKPVRSYHAWLTTLPLESSVCAAVTTSGMTTLLLAKHAESFQSRPPS